MALTGSRDLKHFADPPSAFRSEEELAKSSADISSPEGGFEVARIAPVEAAVMIYAGAFVGLSAAGKAQPLIAGDPFLGISQEDRSSTDATRVKVWTQGDFEHVLTGAAAADVGRPAFASDDGTLTFAGTGNSYVGIVREVPTSDNVVIRVDPGSRPIKSVVYAVEDLLVGADVAARAVHCFQEAVWITAVRVVNQSAAAAGIDADNTAIVTVANAAGTVASKTFNGTVTFPGPNAALTLGTITYPHCVAGDVLTLAVTQGVTADLGPFLVEVDYA